VAAQVGAVQSVAQPVLGIYAAGGSAASAGAMVIMVQFYIP
jgi:membrane-bound ClpP family serine protease